MACLQCMQRAAPLPVSSSRTSRQHMAAASRGARPAVLRQTTTRPCRLPQRLYAQAEDVAAEAEDGQHVSDAQDVDKAAALGESTGAAPAALESSAPADDGSEFSQNYSLNVLWLDKSMGLAVDQVFKGNQKSPVTEFFFWPKMDAWEQMNVALEAKDWITERDRVLLLNQCTDVINFWQEEERKTTIEDARSKYPSIVFQGA